MGLVFDPQRTKYQLPDGLEVLIEDTRSMLGEEFDAYDSKETGEVLLDALGDCREISLSDFMSLFRRLRNTGRIQSNEELDEEAETRAEEIVPADNRPRGADGHLLTEHEIFYTTQTALNIRERIKTDRTFAEFARTQMAGEFKLADGAKPAAPPPTNMAEQQLVDQAVHPALRKFAQQFQDSSRAQLRPINGIVTMSDGTKFTKLKFEALVNEASVAGIL